MLPLQAAPGGGVVFNSKVHSPSKVQKRKEENLLKMRTWSALRVIQWRASLIYWKLEAVLQGSEATLPKMLDRNRPRGRQNHNYLFRRNRGKKEREKEIERRGEIRQKGQSWSQNSRAEYSPSKKVPHLPPSNELLPNCHQSRAPLLRSPGPSRSTE